MLMWFLNLFRKLRYSNPVRRIRPRKKKLLVQEPPYYSIKREIIVKKEECSPTPAPILYLYQVKPTPEIVSAPIFYPHFRK
jgi:hypothetical protein